jgi:DNA-binding NtrC family response regulator
MRAEGNSNPGATIMAMPFTQVDVHQLDTRDQSRRAATPRPGRPVAQARVRILLADGEQTVRDGCASVLRHEGHDVEICNRGQEALEVLKRRTFDVLLVDSGMAEVEGLTLLRTALAANRDMLGIVMTSNPSVGACVEALAHGAWEYLAKPFTATQLQILIGRAVHTLLAARQAREPQAELERRHGHSDKVAFLGAAPAFRRAIELARKVAPTDVSVLITGESGSGKELIAQFIHHHSRRSAQPLVAINCAALPEGLLESEMFGHRKGAFTGADRDKRGLLEAAHGGTLFLDELLEMPRSIQAKLLRVIQDGEVRRVGSETKDAVVNVRFLAATNGDPGAAVKAGELREDFYYRLRVVPIHVPPLRQRPDDIPLLAAHFLHTCWARHRQHGAPCPTLTDQAVGALRGHPWRGNVRELQNVIERTVVVMEPGVAIRPADLQLLDEADPVATHTSLSNVHEDGYYVARNEVVGQFEREYVTALVRRTGGNMSEAARAAGLDRTTLYRIMERIGLRRSLLIRPLKQGQPFVEPPSETAAGGVGATGSPGIGLIEDFVAAQRAGGRAANRAPVN